MILSFLDILCDDTFLSEPFQHQFLSEALQWRAQTDPDHVLYVLLNAKVNTHSSINLRNWFVVRINASDIHTDCKYRIVLYLAVLMVIHFVGCEFICASSVFALGGGSVHSHLCSVTQESRENHSYPYGERRPQHRRQRGAALSPR